MGPPASELPVEPPLVELAPVFDEDPPLVELAPAFDEDPPELPALELVVPIPGGATGEALQPMAASASGTRSQGAMRVRTCIVTV
jgi:hypothetical protein